MTLRLIANDGEGGGGGGPHPTINVVWFDVNWSWTEGVISGAAQGFDLVLYTGSDPNAEAAWLGSQIIRVPITSTRCVVSFTLAVGTSPGAVKAAVRTRYPGEVSAWALAAVAATPAPKNVLPAASDNLIPNYNSELGTQFTGVASALVVQDAANAVAGDYCRKLDASATNLTDLTGFIPCMPGDLFYLEAMAKVSSGSAAVKLRIAYFDKTFASVGTPADSVAISGTSYPSAPVGVTGTIPATAVYAKAQVFASTTAASQFGYFDQLLLRRADGQTIQVAGSYSYTSPGTYTPKVPAGVRRIKVTLVGPGGGGSAGTTNSKGGCGGGGGSKVVDYFDVTPGDTITASLGSAGVGGTTSGASGIGGNTAVVSVGTHVATANGGDGATSSKGGNGGNPIVRGRAYTTFATGGNVGVGAAGALGLGPSADVSAPDKSWGRQGSGGGGGGAMAFGGGGTTTNLDDLGGNVGGVAGSTNGSHAGGGAGGPSPGGAGGSGGNASASAIDGGAGTAPGGGGGGGNANTTTFGKGGNGANGSILIEWGPGI